MDRYMGKIAVVTGAASGIGAAVAHDLHAAGVVVVGLDLSVSADRHQQKSTDAQLPIYWLRCDVSSDADVRAAFAWIDEHLGGVDILVNNAGILRGKWLTDNDNTLDMAMTLQVNVLGAALVAREAFQSMKRRQCGGHVVMLCSIAGHAVPYMADKNVSFNMYQPSKHAVRAMTEVLRQEYQMSGLPIKISSVSPGVVETAIFPKEFDGIATWTPLKPQDVSDTIMFVLSTPPHVQVHDIIVKPMGEKL